MANYSIGFKMNASFKTYLILALFAFIHISEVFHSLSHEHRFCPLHNQIEENHQGSISEIYGASQDGVHATNSESDNDDHVACDILSCLQKNSLLTSQSSMDQIHLVEKHAHRLSPGYRSSPLIQSPKTSPPSAFA